MKKFKTREAAEAWVDSLTLVGIREALVELLLEPQEPQVKKISISEQQFAEHFRLIGVGETRGRKKKS